jgi:hypothetical protein
MTSYLKEVLERQGDGPRAAVERLLNRFPPKYRDVEPITVRTSYENGRFVSELCRRIADGFLRPGDPVDVRAWRNEDIYDWPPRDRTAWLRNARFRRVLVARTDREGTAEFLLPMEADGSGRCHAGYFLGLSCCENGITWLTTDDRSTRLDAVVMITIQEIRNEIPINQLGLYDSRSFHRVRDDRPGEAIV